MEPDDAVAVAVVGPPYSIGPIRTASLRALAAG